VPGNPIPTARARVVTKGGRTWAFTPQRTKQFQDTVAFYAANAMRLYPKAAFPLSGNLILTIWFYRDSWRRADLDNLTKGVKDALTSVHLWSDDSQVVDSMTHKRVSALEPRTEVTIEVVG